MSGSMRMRPVAVLAMSVLLGATLASRARAGEIPSSALARSWGIDPILIDSPQLLYQFPQRAAASDSMGSFGVPLDRSTLWATTDADVWDADEQNLGAIWRGRSLGVFALAQPNYLAGGDFVRAGAAASWIGDMYPQPYQSESDVLQAGVGARWGVVRAGLAFRATRHRGESGTRDAWSDGSTTLRGQQNQLDYQELAVGLGADWRGACVDAAFEWQDEQCEEAFGESTPDAARATTLQGESRGSSGFAARVDAPVGERVHLVAAGHYHWGDRTWAGTRYESTSSRAIAFGERAKTWSAHLGIVVATALVDRLVFAGSAVHYDEPLSGLASSELWTASRKVARGTVTVAGEKSVWRTLAVRAGVSGDYTKAEENLQSLEVDRAQSRTQETLTDRFHWGLSYRWRGLRFEASLQSPPVIDNPFQHFDLYWSF